MAGDEVKVPVFDGANYNMWKKRLVLFLKWKKSIIVIERKKTETDKDDWDQNDLKAMNYIYGALSDKQLEYVCDLETSFDIIKKLDSLYLKESTALQIVCRNKVERLRLKNYSDCETFFSDFEKAINELKSAGANISEKEKLNYILNTLPDSYSYIGDLTDTLKEEEQTADYVKNKIQMAELKRQKEENNGRKSNVFTAEKRTCFNCGKPGHVQRDCKNGAEAQASNNDGQAARGRGTWRARGWRGGQEGGRRNYVRGRGSYRGWRGASAQPATQQEVYNAWVATVNHHAAHNTEMENVSCNEVKWILDSGCTDHIINNDRYFENSKTLKNPVNVHLGDNRIVKATKIGNVVCYFDASGKKNKVNIKNVFFVKDMHSNLISYSKITDNNKTVSERNTSKIIDKFGNLTAIAFKINNLYYIKGNLKYENKFVNIANKQVDNMSLKEKWHRILGHVNFKYLEILIKNKLLNGMPREIENEFMKCKTCIESKMHNVPFKNNRSKAQEILEIVHTDVCGPFSTTGFKGEKYFISFIDDYSKIARVYVMKSKSEVFDCVIEYINEVENLTGKRVKILRCDNGKEYLNGKIYNFCKSKGIKIDNCPAYVHELNGVAERFNRTIMDISRSLLAKANIHKKYWPEIVCAATYLRNRTLTNTVEMKTPCEIFFGKKPDVSNLRLYGSKVFVRIPEQKRTSKWEKRPKWEF